MSKQDYIDEIARLKDELAKAQVTLDTIDNGVGSYDPEANDRGVGQLRTELRLAYADLSATRGKLLLTESTLERLARNNLAEARRIARLWLGREKETEQQAIDAEARAGLVTPELADLLERLAERVHIWSNGDIEDMNSARAVAARIREALEATE